MAETRRRRRWIRPAGVLVACAVVLVPATLFLLEWTLPHGGPDLSTNHEIRIEPGMSLEDVANLLAREKLIGSPAVFCWGARLKGQDRNIQAGRYLLSGGISPRRILDRLVSGTILLEPVTLPEGLTAEEYAGIVADSLDVSAAAFLVAADSLVREHLERETWLGDAAGFKRFAELMRGHGPAQPRDLHWCEGYLAPDTYHFAEGTGAADIARTVAGTGLLRVESACRLLGPSSGPQPSGTPLWARRCYIIKPSEIGMLAP